ncbi:hypothetical protein F5B18DRAFT_42218 [Nemania serpens]|nr:hypothetical protein F5B18DRAFT_42218 [Nemania serpens]
MSTLTISNGDMCFIPSRASPLRVGDHVTFISSSTVLRPDSGSSGNNTSLNFLSGDDDYVLRTSFRRIVQVVSLNSRYANANWDPEGSFKFEGPFANGKACYVYIAVQESSYSIHIDGRLRYTYARRIIAPVVALRYASQGAGGHGNVCRVCQCVDLYHRVSP